MTDTASPDKPDAAPDLARFFQDWTALWMEELQAQARETTPMPLSMPTPLAGPAPAEVWRAVMAQWTKGLGGDGPFDNPAHNPAGSPPAAAASDPRDAEIERLARRVGELEARIARLEAPRRRRS